MRFIQFRAGLPLSGLLVSLAATVGADARNAAFLDGRWKFHSGEAADAAVASLDDSSWASVSLPHNWGWEEAQQGRPFYRGPSWYRYPLIVKGEPDRRYFVRFGAASTVADVYLNGTHLGQHRGGFGAFCFEVTTNLASSGTNLLAVRVSNAPVPDIAPLGGDFNVYGGLYRSVQLLETGMQAFSVTDHASCGVAWLQTGVGPERAVLEVTAQVANGSSHSRAFSLVTKVLAADGGVVAQTNEIIHLAPECTAPYWSRVEVAHPHLWNGRKDPYLYRAVVELRATNGEVADAVTQPLGLRHYRVDPERGFLLNGERYPVYGVCRHQDRFNKGWAITPADMEEDVQLIREMGATAVRCAHYEHSEHFYDLCDREGLLVWAEIPQVNDIENVSGFEETSRGQLLDLMRQNINHSSIFAWSLFNEVGNGHTDDPHRELQNLNRLAHSEDPTRPTIGATCTSKFPQMNRIPDLLGWNIYPGWYGDKDSLSKFGAWLEAHRFSSRSGGFCVSEYGAGANPAQHEDPPKQPRTTGAWHPEEWQALVHERDWAAIRSHSFVWGSFLWNMFDFCVADRHEGSLPGLNDKGLVTFERQVKKDAFYFYKANWSTEPVLYLAGRRFVERTNAVTDIKVYSNARAVELVVNGVGQRPQASDSQGVFLWKMQRLRSGENLVEARAEFDGVILKDSCVWNCREGAGETEPKPSKP
jgi:beta-galactosidase